jgi:hypothetical protein
LLTAPSLSDLLKGETQAKASFDGDYDSSGDAFSGGKIRRVADTGGAVPANRVRNEATIVVNEICDQGGLPIPTLQFAPPRKVQPR